MSAPAITRPVARASRGTTTRSRTQDTLEAVAWLVGTGAVACMLASGTVDLSTGAGALVAGARVTGMVASTTILVQLVLIARVPLVERAIGHDRAAVLHGRLGRLGFLVILAHVALSIVGYAASASQGVVAQAWELIVGFGEPMFMAWAGLAVLVAVVVTSYAVVRARWRYENWHAVHVFSYLAIGLTIPHQLTDGETFLSMGFAWWYWMLLWSLAVGSLLVFRVLRPLVRAVRHRTRVAAVTPLPDGSVDLVLHGRALSRMWARSGQFVLLRFIAPGMWGQAHPYSLSRAPLPEWWRFTIKPLGDASRAVAHVPVGTRVIVEGPLGIFTADRATGEHLVLAGAGVGVTPLIGLLEDAPDGGRCTVIVRGSTEHDIPHLDEIRRFATAKGAALHVLTGPRGDGWRPLADHHGIGHLVPDLARSDVYACGPAGWVDALEADARAAGLTARAFHRELFAW
ncbi:ferredoxin reductase family protein [Demequina sp. NBRC 110051]|uniref:ferredoxin reductase family protein n=1 Tax=Demequina sp. NBRC 110051 TaxID=1570340 RepID=UPI000A068CA0|nr:ferredoxin reductase family protein [Demequina sp. NBRC 110051]